MISTDGSGLEFNSTVLVLTRNELHVLTSDKKAKILEPLAGIKGCVKLVLHTYSATPSPDLVAALTLARACEAVCAGVWVALTLLWHCPRLAARPRTTKTQGTLPIWCAPSRGATAERGWGWQQR